jgi:hypothetical protein
MTDYNDEVRKRLEKASETPGWACPLTTDLRAALTEIDQLNMRVRAMIILVMKSGGKP